MIDTLPADTPVIIPEVDPAVAIVGSLLLHVPQHVRSLSVAVVPGHTGTDPDIATGSGSTDTVVVMKQPVVGV